MRKSPDAIVLGLGGVGSAAAYHLAIRQRRVLGIEQFQPAHDLGSSHGGSRIIRQAYHEHPAYVPLVRRSYELWRELERSTDEDLLTITGGLLIGPENGEVVQGALRSARIHVVPHELLRPADIRRRFPLFHVEEGEAALFEGTAGFLRPERAVRAHLEQAARAGADLHFGEVVMQWSATRDGRVNVTTDRASYQAESLILAPGAWAPRVMRDLDLPLIVRRHLMCWFDPVVDSQLFSPAQFPIYLWQSSSGTILYGFPAIDGPHGGAKAAIHTGGEIVSPDTLNRELLPIDEVQIREQLCRLLPALNGPLLHSSACMYTLTRDEHFLLGPHPQWPQVNIACGFSGHGFKFCSVMGEILADLATNGTTRHSIEFLSLSRFQAKDTTVH
jgi:sarcosine oxidase